MRKTGLRVAVAIALLLVLGLLLWLGDTPDAPSVTMPHEPMGEREAAPVSLDELAQESIAAETTRETADESVPGAEAVDASGKFVFDVTFVPVDAQGRPLADVSVEMGLPRHRPNVMGKSGRQGELHMKWRGTEPALDAFLSSSHGKRSTLLTRVRIVAGSPCVVRFQADTLREVPFLGSVPLLQAIQPPDATAHLAPYSPPSFQFDAAGNGSFHDPDLLVRERSSGSDRSNAELVPTPFTTRRLANLGYAGTTRSAGNARPARLTCSVHDAEGRALSDVPVRVFRARGRAPEEGRTDEEGRYVVLSRESGRITIELGGGLLALVRHDFDLAPEEVATREILVTSLPIVRARLVDPEGAPLADWRVQARESLPPFGFLQSARTDPNGVFALGLLHGEPARLLASPPDADDRPAYLVAKAIGPGADQLEFVVRNAHQRSSVTWHFDVPAAHVGNRPQARIVRTDSDEGLTLDPCDHGDAGDGLVRWAFCVERLLPGEYVLTNFAPGGSSEYRVGLAAHHENVGDVPLDPTMSLRFGNDRERWGGGSVTAVVRSQGLEVRSEPSAVPGRFVTLARPMQLRFQGLPGQSGDPIVRDIGAAPGVRLEFALDDLR